MSINSLTHLLCGVRLFINAQRICQLDTIRQLSIIPIGSNLDHRRQRVESIRQWLLEKAWIQIERIVHHQIGIILQLLLTVALSHSLCM